MRKSTIFISSVLTTFALVVLFGVVKAYQNNTMTQAADAVAQPPAVVNVALPTDVPTQAPTVITPEEAAQLAVQVVGHDNLYSAETSTFNNVPAYLITFTNKDVVYIGLDGQVLSVQIAPIIVNVVSASQNNNNGGGGGGGGGGEDHTEHEDHDDD